MKKINGLRKLLALILTVAMAGGMISAYAETVINQNKYLGGLDEDLDVIVDDNANSDHTVAVYGTLNGDLTVDVSDAWRVNVYVQNGITDEVKVSAENGGIADVSPNGDIGGNVTITAENGGRAILAQPYEDAESNDTADIAGSATLEAYGGGTAELKTGDVKEITAAAIGTDDNKKASTVTVTAQKTGAVVSSVYDGGEVDITVEDVAVTSTEGHVSGVSINQGQDPYSVFDGSTTVQADSVFATTMGDNKNAFGLLIKDGTAIIGTDEKKDTNGDVLAIAEKGIATGIATQGNSDVTVYGDVSAEAGNYARGVFADSSESESKVRVEGSVTVKGDGGSYGVVVSSEQGSTTVVYAQNGISASGAFANAISTTTHSNGDSSVFVQGDVKAESATGYAEAVVISCQGGNTTINVDGNVTGDGIANGTAAGYGIIANYITSYSSAQVEINGTLSGTAAGILVNDDKDAIDTKKADISVWAAKENKDSNIAVSFSGDTNNQTKALEDSIHYIIRIADAFKGMLTNDAVTPESSTKTVTFGEGEDQKVYKTADMGEKVTIDTSGITLAENEVLKGVYYYYDTDENGNAVTSEAITENTNGIFTLTMGMSTILKNARGMMQLGLMTHKHDFSTYVGRDKEPTCMETGIDRYQCTGCDATITETVAINPDNHTPAKPVRENELVPGASVEGSYEEVTYCTACGAEISRHKVIVPPLEEKSKQEANTGEADIAEGGSMTGNDIDLDAVPMPKDVSNDDDDVNLDKFANCPDALKETAKQELSALRRSGYKIDCGCGAWSKSGKTAACMLKLSEKDVPDGAQIFVNGAAVQAELKDGYYYFDITLPAVVLVAHK